MDDLSNMILLLWAMSGFKSFLNPFVHSLQYQKRKGWFTSIGECLSYITIIVVMFIGCVIAGPFGFLFAWLITGNPPDDKPRSS